MDSNLQDVSVCFDERMSGYISPAPSNFETGYTQGAHEGRSLEIRVRVQIRNLAAFLGEPEHRGGLSGTLHCEELGGECSVVCGRFGLLTDTADQDRKAMSYQLHCESPNGRQFTFDGLKRVQHDTPLDLWPDTTTLYVNIYEGHIDPSCGELAVCLYSGKLNLGLAEFIQLLATLKAKTAVGESSPEGLLAFARYFAGKLADVYCWQGPQETYPETERRFAPFTLEGVPDACKSVHLFDTPDKLSLMMTRFQRGNTPGRDVVLLVHGLTSASNMFYMPEHRNLVQTLLDHGYRDVWALDHRGSCRFPYNLHRHSYNLDDMALYDLPSAVAEIRRQLGADVRIHLIAHCVGAIASAMSLFAGTLTGVRSAVLGSVALTPWVPWWPRLKLRVGPWASDNLLGSDYFNPSWARQAGFSWGKVLAKLVNLWHRECDSPECHMLSFMWGQGAPAVFRHENLSKVTHDRLADLFGGTGVNYYRHILKMVLAGNTAVKMRPNDPRYAALPANYFARAAEMTTPLLLAQGQQNRVFFHSNELCHKRLEAIVPGRHQLAVVPGYGHQDLFIGQHADRDVFPRFIEFLEAHRHD